MGKFYYTDVGKAFLRSIAYGASGGTQEVQCDNWSASNNNFDNTTRTGMYPTNTYHPLAYSSGQSGNFGIASPDIFASNFGTYGATRHIVGTTSITKSGYSNKSFSYTFTISNNSGEEISVKTIYSAGISIRQGSTSSSASYHACTWGYELDNAITIPAGDSASVTVQIKFE